MSKRLLLIGGNFAPELTGIGKYNGEMVNWLANNGYECTVITSFPHYPQWKVQPPYTNDRYWYKKEQLQEGRITVYRCPQYIPGRPSGSKRILMDISFALSATIVLLLQLFRPKADVVMVVAPPFHLGLLGVLYSHIRKTDFIYHIQDLQIEAARDLRMITSSIVIKLMFGMEKFILKRATVVSSISEGMINKIRYKTNNAVIAFPNWVDVQLFHPLADKHQIKTVYGFKEDDKVILYAGAIGEKQGLESILYVAATVRHLPHIHFLICGAGPYREQLHQQVISQALNNVHFRDPEPFSSFNQLLNMADVHLVIQKASAGDLVMPSKLTTILAVGGLAVVTANEKTGLHKVVTENKMGIVVPADDAQALATGILQAIYKSQAHITGNARQYALEYLAIDSVMSKMDDVIRASR